MLAYIWGGGGTFVTILYLYFWLICKYLSWSAGAWLTIKP